MLVIRLKSEYRGL